MRPENLKTRMFLDGGDVKETRSTIDALGFLDGQTTNPTLISKNPEARERLDRGEKFRPDELLGFYRDVVGQISKLIPDGSVSVEVFSDLTTTPEAMLTQGRKMFSWIPNAHIKFPTSTEGLKAASQAIKEGMRVNMTLCFSQEQAAAVYAATRGAKRGDVFVSPFIGRLDDRGENGMDLIAHIVRMYKESDGHVEVLTASVRKIEHIYCAIKLGSDIITSPFRILKEWSEEGLQMPGESYTYPPEGLRPIPYRDIDLSRDWRDYDISHELTVKGMKTFSDDWNRLLDGAHVAPSHGKAV